MTMKMKLIHVLGCALAALMIISCEKEIPVPPARTMDPDIEWDFISRYPDATVSDISKFSEEGKTMTEIDFVDKDGFRNHSIYVNSRWMITEKTYDVEDFLYSIPRKVARTYISTGIENEVYRPGSDYYYVLEIARSGFDKKQYEFRCLAPFDDGIDTAENLVYEMVIDEDGTLLTCVHYHFNRSIWWYDITSSYQTVRSKYPNATMLGAVNDGGSNVLFIRDNGIMKTVTTRNRGDGFTWIDTRYPLDINTPLPASVLATKEEYAAKHPGEPFYALYSVDCPEGHFYGLTFGSELNNTTFFSRAEE